MGTFVVSLVVAAVALLAVSHVTDADLPCIPRKFNHSSVMCVCNSTYCDEISKISSLGVGRYVVYSSSMDGLRFRRDEGYVIPDLPAETPIEANRNEGDAKIKIDRSQQYQTIHGFGGSFTDATGYNLVQLSKETQNKFMRAYFSEDGLEYNMARVPIGGTDFSTHPYAYNMEPRDDIALSNFTLTEEDFTFKIPFINIANDLATDEIKYVGSAWSSPIWMKTNNAYGGISRLIEQYYQTWANYHLRFLEEYKKNNVSFWALTTGNEPSNGIIPVLKFNSLGWMPREQGKWVAENLGPTLRNSEFSDIKILGLDDQRFSLPWWIEWMSENENALSYISGIATHWYWDDIVPPKSVNATHNLFPDLFLLSTEASTGERPWELESVELGSWKRAEHYLRDIIEDLHHWYTGWIDWNLALDREGGPNWFSNFLDSPVITMPENDEFLKQPMFYAMGHFSKFIPRGSKRVLVNQVTGFIDNVAFLRPDGGIAIVAYNPYDYTKALIIEEEGRGTITLHIPKRSAHSIVYW